jgi:hypothetical protein
LISSISQIFSEAGLGAEHYALFSLVPALQQHIDISGGEGLLVTLFKEVSSCKGPTATWSETQSLLHQVYKNFIRDSTNADFIRQIAVAEGELLRRAMLPSHSLKVRVWAVNQLLRDPSRYRKKLRGFQCWRETKQRYSDVAQAMRERDKELFLSSERSGPAAAHHSNCGTSDTGSKRSRLATFKNLKTPAAEETKQTTSLAERAAEISAAVQAGDRTKTLILLTGADVPVSHLDPSLLGWAASHGWSEVVLSLLDVGTYPIGTDEDGFSAVDYYTKTNNTAMKLELMAVVQDFAERKAFEE